MPGRQLCMKIGTRSERQVVELHQHLSSLPVPLYSVCFYPVKIRIEDVIILKNSQQGTAFFLQIANRNYLSSVVDGTRLFTIMEKSLMDLRPLISIPAPIPHSSL